MMRCNDSIIPVSLIVDWKCKSFPRAADATELERQPHGLTSRMAHRLSGMALPVHRTSTQQRVGSSNGKTPGSREETIQMGKLDNRVAVITAATSGMALATAKLFVEEGAYVFIMGRRQDKLDEAVKTIGRNVTGCRETRQVSSTWIASLRQ